MMEISTNEKKLTFIPILSQDLLRFKYKFLTKYGTYLYSGKSIAEENLKIYNCEYIYVYNWEGEKIRTLKLDVPVISLCITPDDKTIYAVAVNPDYELVKFKL